MTNQQEQVARLLRLPDADYFSFDQDRQLKLQSALAKLVNNGDSAVGSSSSEPILAVGSPANIDIDKRSSVPVLIGHVQTGLRAWQANFESNLHLFVRSLSTGKLSAAQPLINMRRGEQPLLSGVGTPPDPTTSGTLYVGVSLVNVRDKLSDAVTPGVLSVTTVVNELRSNSVAIRIQSSAPPPPPPPASSQPYVRYKLEPREGFATQVDVPNTAPAKDAIRIRVAMQVSASAEMPKTRSGQTFWTFHIVLVKLDERPEIIPVTVPVQEVGSATGQHRFNASFEVDARAAARSKLYGKYQVYVDAGFEFLGPYPLSVS